MTSGRTGLDMNTRPAEILLVEDNEDDVVYFEETLIASKFVNTIHVVKDGEEALDYVRRTGKHKDAPMPSLILLDIKLPKKGGFEVLQELSADPRLRQIPVIMLTVSTREEDEYKSFLEGACGYIRKPVSFEKLFRALKLRPFFWSLLTSQPAVPAGPGRG